MGSRSYQEYWSSTDMTGLRRNKKADQIDKMCSISELGFILGRQFSARNGITYFNLNNDKICSKVMDSLKRSSTPQTTQAFSFKIPEEV